MKKKPYFYTNQNDQDKKLYVDLLEIMGSLSNLFSESQDPYLHYRAMENIFCKSFNANNLSRSDVSVDATKNGMGIGLKTFLQKNGQTYQKVAEFNKDSSLLKGLEGLKLVEKVSYLRNRRIKSTMNICALNEVIYHLITRNKNHMSIYEEPMDFINLECLKVVNHTDTTIHFTDDKNEYSFNLSKSTLFKKFMTEEENKIYEFQVDIIKDPYDTLLHLKNKQLKIESKVELDNKVVDYIVLPLYSPRDNKVKPKSGLNQWNAGGRKRNKNEVYISIPSWIHREKKGFFKYNTEDFKTEPFNVSLPNGKVLSMKVAQQGGKALMSNPNLKLGEWILREILELDEGKLVTKEMLDIIGIDSVKLSKLENGTYLLDFLKSGSYENFASNYMQ